MANAEPLTEPSGSAPAAPAHPWRARAVMAIRILAVLAIGYFIVDTTVRQWEDVRSTFGQLSWGLLLLSLLGAVASLWANTMAWRAVMNNLDHRISVRDAGPIQLVGQLGKYLPGTVWAYVVQMELGRRAGVARSKVFVASVVLTGLGVSLGLVLVAPGLGVAFEGAHDSPYPRIGSAAVWTAIVLLPIAVVCSLPPVLTRLVKFAMRLLRRPALDRPITWRAVLSATGWNLVAYIAFGMHLWLLVRAELPGLAGLVGSVWVIGLAMSLSAFVILAPSGIGVREFLVAVGLVGLGMPWTTSWALALASRLLLTIADVLAAGVAAAVGLRRIKREPAQPEPEHAEA